ISPNRDDNCRMERTIFVASTPLKKEENLKETCVGKGKSRCQGAGPSDRSLKNICLYSNLSLCTEEISDCLVIPWPNPLVEQTFVNIHTTFFKDCPTEELSDPPPAIVFALVITPICLIPVM
ncbi:hypothetical protein L3Q82_013960, partial [Scortum barcoo]